MKNKGWLIFGISLALIVMIGIVIVLNMDQPPVNTGKPNEGNSTKPPPKPNTAPPVTPPVVNPPVVSLPPKVGDVLIAAIDGTHLYDLNLNQAQTVNKGTHIGVALAEQNAMFQFITASGVKGWVSKINVTK